MRRHETDWLALSLGGLFLLVAAVHIRDGDGADGVDGLRWFVPGVLLVLGVLGIIAAVRGGRTPAEVGVGQPTGPGGSAPSPAPSSADEPTVRLDREPEGVQQPVPEPASDLADPDRAAADDEGDDRADDTTNDPVAEQREGEDPLR